MAAITALNIITLTQPIPEITLSTAIFSAVACFIGGLTPDIDKPTSDFWQKIPAGTLAGKILHPFFGKHRHISHSILGLIIFGVIVSFALHSANKIILVNMDIVWASFMVGVISHLVMDSLTTEGVPWLFPIPFHFGFPPFRALRIVTGGLIEKIIVFPGLLVLNFYLFYRFYSFYIHFLKLLIQ